MKASRTISTLALALVCAAGAAWAQKPDSGRGASADAFIQYCVATTASSGFTNPVAQCSCGAGVMSGRMSDREYAIMGRLSPHGANQTAMMNEIRAMMQDGYSPEEVSAVGTMMVDLGPLIGATCDAVGR